MTNKIQDIYLYDSGKYPFSAIFIVFMILMVNNGNTLLEGNFVLLIYALFLLTKSKILESNLLNKMLGSCAILVLFLFATTITFNKLPPIFFVGRNLLYIIIAFSILHIYKHHVLILYEKIMFYLVILSLIFFTIQIVNYNALFSVVKYFHDIINYKPTDYMLSISYYANMFVYTINSPPGDLLSQRNCGFLFEPGFFAIFISIAIIINLLKNNLKLTGRFYIYIIALVSTQSTTGYLALVLILLFNIFNHSQSKYKILYVPVAVVAIYFISISPIVYNKTIEAIKASGNAMNLAIVSSQQDNFRFTSLGRFAGFQYEYKMVVKESPVFGFCGYKSDERKKGLIAANGMAEFLKDFGFLGLLLMFFAFYKSSSFIVKCEYGKKYSIFIFLIFMIFLFSFGFQYTLLFWILLFYGIGSEKEIGLVLFLKKKRLLNLFSLKSNLESVK